MLIGIELHLKDGTKDWYDPVEESEFDQNESPDIYVINNGYHVYQVEKALVEKVVKYELCPECLFDIRSERHTNTCSFNEDDKDA